MKTQFPKQHNRQGFTLIELMVAAAIGLITVMAAGQAMVSQIESSQKISRRERLRGDWVAANQFINSEINQSIKVSTEAGDELIEECGIESTQIKMVIQFGRNQQIKPAIYYTSEDEDGWNGILLKRCGPAINSTGNYIDALSNEIIVDDLKNINSGFQTTIVDEKLVKFNIALNGLIDTRYQQQGASRSRIQHVIVRPEASSICIQDSQDNIDGVKINLTSGSDQFTSNENQDLWNRQTNGDALICGHGGGDTITGGSGNNLIEAGGVKSSIIDGGDGDDRIIGSDGDDVIDGGDGDDILIGLGGNDILRGGSGNNHFISGIDEINNSCDHDRVIGLESSFNIIYFEEIKAKYILSDPCNQALCRITKRNTNNKKNVDVESGDILAFADETIDLPQGESGNLLPLNRDSCDVQIAIHEPPEPEVNAENDPRWQALDEAKTIGFRITSSVIEEYTKETRSNFIENWKRNIEAMVNDLPDETKERFCFTPSTVPFINPELAPRPLVKLFIRRKIDGRCVSGNHGNVLLSSWPIFVGSKKVNIYGSARIPKRGTSFQFCNLHYKTYFSAVRPALFREAPGC